MLSLINIGIHYSLLPQHNRMHTLRGNNKNTMNRYSLFNDSCDLFTQKIQLIQRYACINFILHSVLLLILSSSLYLHTTDVQLLLLWTTLTGLLVSLRFVQHKALKNKQHRSKKQRIFHLKIYILFTSLVNLLWGLNSVLFLPELVIQQILLIIALSTILIASITLLSISRYLFYLQACLLFTPLLGQLLSLENTDYKILALLLLIMCLMLILMTNTIYHMLHESQKIQYTAQTQARTDPLTQLANRRGFDQQLQIEWQRAVCTGLPLSLLMIDVDHFKQYNDQKGHLSGDTCLKDIAQSLRNISRRKQDYITRYGGDEFSILLPETVMPDAIILAERLRQEIAILYTQAPSITLSIGVASCKAKKAHYHHPYPPQAHTDILVNAADQALYQAKAQGRNCVVTQYCDRPL